MRQMVPRLLGLNPWCVELHTVYPLSEELWSRVRPGAFCHKRSASLVSRILWSKGSTLSCVLEPLAG
eukprot:5017150-Pyramimonas_sp.AAC.1